MAAWDEVSTFSGGLPLFSVGPCTTHMAPRCAPQSIPLQLRTNIPILLPGTPSLSPQSYKLLDSDAKPKTLHDLHKVSASVS